MRYFSVLVLFPLLVCCSGGGTKEPPPEAPPSPTIVNASVSLDCETRQTPTGTALMSDGTFEHLSIYPAGNGVSISSITCVDGESVFDIVDCNGNSAAFFCLPQNFTCSYFASSGPYSQELCTAQG
jgi:hypothetical protein